MHINTLKHALDLTSSNTVEEFFNEVIEVYIEKQLSLIGKSNSETNDEVAYELVWGNLRQYRAIGYSSDKKTIRIVAGSDFQDSSNKSLTENYNRLRQELILSGIVESDDNQNNYKFTENYTFTSFSAAASVVKGVQSNGLTAFSRIY